MISNKDNKDNKETQEQIGEEGDKKKIQVFRFYKNVYPKQDEFVVVEVSKVEENIPTVKLLEYGNIEGIITPNELTKTMQMHVHKALRIGKKEVVKVLRVDEDKGYIDLSKKQVNQHQENICNDKFSVAKSINSILISIIEKWKVDKVPLTLELLYTQIIWPMNDKANPIDILKSAIDKHEVLDNYKVEFKSDDKSAVNQQELNDKLRKMLLEEINRRLQPSSLNIRAEFELQCLTYQGIDAIKQAMKDGEKFNEKNFEVKFYMVGSPLYSAAVVTQDKVKGQSILLEALKEVEASIKKQGGYYKLIKEPKVYGDNKDEEHQAPVQQEEEDDEEDSDIDGMGDADDDEEDENQEEKKKN